MSRTLARLKTTVLVLTVALAVALGIMASPAPVWLLCSLENRFPRSAAVSPFGIILLGGTLNFDLTFWTPDSELSGAAKRLRATVQLARQFPAAKVLFTGGGGTPAEAEIGRDLLIRSGVEPTRILIETRSRTTAENAAYSRELLGNIDGQQWLLVTSATHMPRAMGAFRAAGFRAEPYPVDRRCNELSADRLRALRIALKEYAGLLAYRVTGRTQELFPAPSFE